LKKKERPAPNYFKCDEVLSINPREEGELERENHEKKEKGESTIYRCGGPLTSEGGKGMNAEGERTGNHIWPSEFLLEEKRWGGIGNIEASLSGAH